MERRRKKFPGTSDDKKRPVASLVRTLGLHLPVHGGKCESGKRLSFAGIVSAFEKLFNVAIPKPYDLRADLARRKKNYSVLLPKLKETFEKNIAACGNGK